jgi:hypothetical protein
MATDAKPSPLNRAIAKFGYYFREHGLEAADIPAAIVVHELLGAAMASAAWAVRSSAEPTQRLHCS